MNAREKLITDHIGIVRIIAYRIWKKYHRQNEIDDLIQSGMIGLIEAADKFDKTRGFKFKTYAERRIAGSILDSIRDDNFLSRSLYDKKKSIDYLKDFLETAGRDSSISVMSKIMNMPEKKISEALLLNHGNSKISIDEFDKFLPHEKNKLLVLSNKKENSLDIVLKKESSLVLKNMVNCLHGNRRKCLWFYFFEGLTMKEIANSMGVTESRVHQIIKKSIFDLKQKIEKKGIDLS